MLILSTSPFSDADIRCCVKHQWWPLSSLFSKKGGRQTWIICLETFIDLDRNLQAMMQSYNRTALYVLLLVCIAVYVYRREGEGRGGEGRMEWLGFLWQNTMYQSAFPPFLRCHVCDVSYYSHICHGHGLARRGDCTCHIRHPAATAHEGHTCHIYSHWLLDNTNMTHYLHLFRFVLCVG